VIASSDGHLCDIARPDKPENYCHAYCPLGGATFRSACCENNGLMTFMHPVWDPMPTFEIPGFQPFSSPFTMTGTVGFDPNTGVTITGQGFST
jgi:hypothetical protein